MKMNREQASLSVDTLELLKAKILKSAIEGKLVPQIEGEPEALQIGKAPEEVPFEIPKKWKWIYLGKAGSWKSGLTPSRSNPAYYENGNVNWLKTGDLNDGSITKTSEKITTAAISETRLRINPIGSVLMAMYGATIGKLGILAVPSTTNQACCACIPENFINSKYLFYFLLARRQQFISMGAGGAQPNISRNKIVNSSFPLPPLEEQGRIVEKLDSLLSKIETIQKSKDEVSRLSESFEKQLLQSAISGKLVPQLDRESEVEQIGQAPQEAPFEIPKKWKWIQIKNLVTKASQKVPDKAFEYVDVSSIDTDYLNIATTKKLEAKEAPSRARKVLLPGMVIYSTVRPYLLKACVIGDEFKGRELIGSTAFASMSCERELLLNRYLLYYLVSPFFTSHVTDVQRGVTYPAIAEKDFFSSFIPLPPLAEQKRIVAKLDKLMLEIQKLQ